MVDGEIKLIGTYAFVSFFSPQSETKESTVSPNLSSPGQYTLLVKDVSDHNRAVRAEITVNDNVVLKPGDFCSSPQPGKEDKDKWKGNDDDDDKDEDHCKRCIPKQEAYTIVNLNATNTIKVKVYGRQDSKLELTLVKKP